MLAMKIDIANQIKCHFHHCHFHYRKPLNTTQNLRRGENDNVVEIYDFLEKKKIVGILLDNVSRQIAESVKREYLFSKNPQSQKFLLLKKQQQKQKSPK